MIVPRGTGASRKVKEGPRGLLMIGEVCPRSLVGIFQWERLQRNASKMHWGAVMGRKHWFQYKVPPAKRK
jgi:hypothetical protein